MKKILFSTLFCLISALVFGQVAFGKEGINGTSTLVNFNDEPTNTKGIILSSVDNLSGAIAATTANNNGTFLFDKSDKKVKMYENGIWKDLSGVGDTSKLVNNSSNETGYGVIIGATTTAATGVLVLESTNKAMVLPKIANPHLTVKSPYAGMMCYDTVGKVVAVFDGMNWNYWK